MHEDIRKLEPQALWNHFADLNAVPRPSKKEERIVRFMVSFGESLGLETLVDEASNVVIRKPASPGMENRKKLVLQGHLDMVHQKNADTLFDFDKEGIHMIREGDWIRAAGTTLGADNGIGVASIMAVLAAKDIAHPPIEALFTVDEETGMTGAKALKGGLLHGDILLNLDTEEDHDLIIGCAGGIDVTATGTCATESTPASYTGVRLIVKGLTGGHSGMDIHLGRGNANKLMNRLLDLGALSFGLRISAIDGGGLRNAIPRESVAIAALPEDRFGTFSKIIDDLAAKLKREYATTDPGLAISIQTVETPEKLIAVDFQYRFLRALYTCPNGIYRMSPDIPGLVQSSNNLARIDLQHGKYTVQCLTRSSVDSEKTDLARAIQSAFELFGATVEFGNEYPGWMPQPNASIVQLMQRLYGEMFGQQPNIAAIHAGLECGIIGTNYPQMDMISFGPNIRGAHSPDEKVQISSVQKFWKYFLATLKNIPTADGKAN